MSEESGLKRVLGHSMRAYYIPLGAGVLLIVSSFLPWIFLGETKIGGVPDPAGYWVLGLGVLAVVLAGLSIWTRKNSRHPLLVVGLTAFAITFLGYQWLSRSVTEAAWARAQAQAIVEGTPAPPAAATTVGMGLYLGMAAAGILVLFGMTVVLKKMPRAYAAPEDDDL
jgi:hypothetical protein